ncbi:Hypothetical predicted protein [Pelobates cultripes]|uniref:Uncharacterized protein n=1 Tax=Pelobates cultripes TaxID=61616 RepID=A0AAD1W468_PELCU|nr:Hypothetical predicted protein [Pelobates cultripes]
MRGFLAEFKKSVTKELDKLLIPIQEGMADLMAWAQETKHKMEEIAEAVNSHDTDLQELREQLQLMEEAKEDLSNRTCWNNIRVRGLLESVSTLMTVFQTLLPAATVVDLLMDRAYQALRAPSVNQTLP